MGNKSSKSEVHSHNKAGEIYQRKEVDTEIKFRIAPFYYQHTIDKLCQLYKLKWMPESTSDLTKHVLVTRSDHDSTLTLEIHKSEESYKKELREVDQALAKILNQAPSSKNLKVPWWYVRKGEDLLPFDAKQNQFVERTYLHCQDVGMVPAKNNMLEYEGKHSYLFFTQDELDVGELDTTDEVYKIVRKLEPITDHEKDLPKVL